MWLEVIKDGMVCSSSRFHDNNDRSQQDKIGATFALHCVFDMILSGFTGSNAELCLWGLGLLTLRFVERALVGSTPCNDANTQEEQEDRGNRVTLNTPGLLFAVHGSSIKRLMQYHQTYPSWQQVHLGLYWFGRRLCSGTTTVASFEHPL